MGREEEKREPKGDIKKEQILPAVKIFYFLLSKFTNLEAKENKNENTKTSEGFLNKKRRERKISLVSRLELRNFQASDIIFLIYPT
jgi:hypothetical protein